MSVVGIFGGCLGVSKSSGLVLERVLRLGDVGAEEVCVKFLLRGDGCFLEAGEFVDAGGMGGGTSLPFSFAFFAAAFLFAGARAILFYANILL